jgi:photoactive yellow protein
MIQSLPAFEEPQLAQIVEKLPEASLHALPYGVIRLNPEGAITFYSETEARLSGYGQRRALGRHLFTEVAPCFAQAGFLRRVEAARATGTVDIAFGHVGDFDDADKELRCRILSASDQGLWVFLQRL